MFCYKCGKQIPDDSEFCPFCGVALTRDNSNNMMHDTLYENGVSQKSENSFINQNINSDHDVKKRRWVLPVVCATLVVMVLLIVAVNNKSTPLNGIKRDIERNGKSSSSYGTIFTEDSSRFYGKNYFDGVYLDGIFEVRHQKSTGNTILSISYVNYYTGKSTFIEIEQNGSFKSSPVTVTSAIAFTTNVYYWVYARNYDTTLKKEVQYDSYDQLFEIGFWPTLHSDYRFGTEHSINGEVVHPQIDYEDSIDGEMDLLIYIFDSWLKEHSVYTIKDFGLTLSWKN